MKRKIISYLLVWLLAVFIVWYCSIYIEAKWEAGINPDLMWDNWDGWWWNGSSSAWSKTKGMAPNWGSDWWWNSTPTTTSPATSDTETTSPKTQNQNNSTTKTSPRKCWDACDWIKLNTCFPIIWDCIETKAEATNPTNAFPYMLRALTKIIMSLILVVCFILIIYAGILWSADKPKDAKKWIERVAITILLLWFSGVILKLVNPNFFS